MPVEFFYRVDQRALRQPQLLFDLLPGFAHGGDFEVFLDHWATEYFVVDQQPDTAVWLAQHIVGDAAVVTARAR